MFSFVRLVSVIEHISITIAMVQGKGVARVVISSGWGDPIPIFEYSFNYFEILNVFFLNTWYFVPIYIASLHQQKLRREKKTSSHN